MVTFNQQTGADNPFNGINVGNSSTPTLADIDGDGDLDALVGERDDNLNYFENTGSTNNPVYERQTGADNPFNGRDVGRYSAPTFADVDGDGNLDAVVGEYYGNLNYFENTGSTSNPVYEQQTGADNPFNGIDVGNFSTPTFADIDGDGDLDAVVGERDGNLNYFENTGSATNPVYEAQTGADNPFNGIDVGFFSNLTLADIDGDGDLDAVVGENDGNLNYFENNQPPAAVDDAVTTDEDTVLSGNVFADNGSGTDSDANGDTLTVTEVNGAAADVGTAVTLDSGARLTLNADGSFDYDPNGQFETLNDGEIGSDSFTYTIDDGNGATDTATVSVTINGVNDAPVADAIVGPDVGVIGQLLTFTGSATDPDTGDSLTLDWSVLDGTNTIATGTGSSFDFLPISPDELTVALTVTDAAGATDTTTLDLNVNLPSNAITRTVLGTGGDDELSGNSNNETIRGKAGNDSLSGRGGDDNLLGNGGNDSLSGGRGNDILDGGGGADRLRGGADNDTLFGGNGGDELQGNNGNDLLMGGNGVDILLGGAGQDVLIGGSGQDVLTGGADADEFVLVTNQGRDTIQDFEDGVDTFWLTGGLTFEDLSFNVGAGSTQIIADGNTLATVLGVDDASLLTAADFTTTSTIL